MAIDRRYCFQCDRWLGRPPSDERRLPLCGGCRADLDAYAEAIGRSGEDDPPPEYLGTVALGLPLDGWPTEIALLTVDLWDRHLELHLVERPGTATADVNPRLAATSHVLGDMTPRKWVLRTDVGTVHHSGGGGGGTPGTDRLLEWRATLAPTLPTAASRIGIVAVAPGAEGHANAAVDRQPTGPVVAEVSVGPGGVEDSDCPGCGPPPTPPPEPGASDIAMSWSMPEPPRPAPRPVPDRRRLCRGCLAHRAAVLEAKVPVSAVPERILVLGAALGETFGSSLVIPSLVVWPTWFDIALTGPATGAWAELAWSLPRSTRWRATDDQGGSYLGTTTGGSSSLGLHTNELTFVPGLDPAAAAITITAPSAIDATATSATIQLHT